MILVTGAGGTVGSALVQELQTHDAPFRAAFHSEEKARSARERGVDTVPIDYARPRTLRDAFEGIDRLFLLGPSAPNQIELELNAVQAAEASGVRHVVKLSVWGAEGEDFVFARTHRPVEKAIEKSNMTYSFLRPNGFMQNLLTYAREAITSDGAIYSATGEGKMSHVDVRDIAAVAARALTESDHENQTYTLSGPEALTHGQIAELLSEALGRTIRHVDLSLEDLKVGLLGAGIPEPMADALVDLDRYYGENRASRISGDVERVTGRAPRSYESYIRESAAALEAA